MSVKHGNCKYHFIKPLIQPGIESEFTASVAGAPPTRPLISFYQVWSRHKKIENSKCNLHYTRCITPKCAMSLRGSSPNHCTCGQNSFLRRNVVVLSRRKDTVHQI